jgi:hypothetical protein
MAITTIPKQRLVPISNLPAAEEPVARAYDANNDGFLDVFDEAPSYVIAKTGQSPAAPLTADDVYQAAGGRQRNDAPYLIPAPAQEVSPDEAAHWANFNIPGLGYGNVRYSRERTHGVPDISNLSINCDFIDKSVIENDVEDAYIVAARAGFRSEPGSQVPEQIAIPLRKWTRDAYVHERYGGFPDKKYLQGLVPHETLRQIAGNDGLDFYGVLKMRDGSTRYINKDGVAFRDFHIPSYVFNSP